jgi:4-hydroxy-3-polyprenylbenzoate decarboxylase
MSGAARAGRLETHMDLEAITEAKGVSGQRQRLIVGISGASGVVYGIRLLEVLQQVEALEVHLVMSAAAKRTILLETAYTIEQVECLADQAYRISDIAAALSSGSFQTLGMVILPCSIKTLSGIVYCYSDNLLLRAADVMLKDRHRLLLAVRETPLHLGHLRMMVQATEMGAIIMPPVPAFYHHPTSLEEIIDQTVNRVLDLFDIQLEHDLFQRWEMGSGAKRQTGALVQGTQHSF